MEAVTLQLLMVADRPMINAPRGLEGFDNAEDKVSRVSVLKESNLDSMRGSSEKTGHVPDGQSSQKEMEQRGG